LAVIVLDCFSGETTIVPGHGLAADNILYLQGRNMENLKELLVGELKDLYSAEKQIVKALPKIIRGASSAELKAAIEEHLTVTKAQVTRLEEVFSHLDEKPKAKHCKGMQGLLEEGAECLQEEEKGALRDLQLIGAAQRVEHYEVAAYGTAKAMAEKLGVSEAVELLNETLQEEEEADKKLTEVAESLYEEVETGDEAPDEEEEPQPRTATAGRRRE
jgi:ferritin-like metal-binding protein YciE